MAGGKTKIAVFSVSNCICHDQRVKKMAGVVTALRYEVVVVGRYRGKCCKTSEFPFSVKRFRMIFRKGFFFYKFFNIRLFFYLLFHRFDLLVANDLDTLLPNYLISRIKRIPLIYDTHEYFTGVPELEGRNFVKRVWKTIESPIFKRLDYILTVSRSVSDQYFSEYGKRAVVIRNCAPSSTGIAPYSKTELGIESNRIVLIFQGAGINVDRGGEELIDAMEMLDNADLFIIGSGDVFEQLRERAERKMLISRVHFISKLPWREMMRYTKMADAGLSLDKNNNMNYKFSLPNKLFDYISAGIPVIAGDLPEVSSVISENSCGVIIPAVTKDEIVKAVRLLDENRDLLKVLKENAFSASERINWEKESELVMSFYKNVLYGKS